MAGSTWPFPWTTGVRPLRADLHARIDLPAQIATELGVVNAQWAALRAGQPVTFTTAQLVSFYPRGDEHPSLPADLTAALAWTLTDDDKLTPAS
jgi:hypothetical protein